MKQVIGFSHIEPIEDRLDRAIVQAFGFDRLHTGIAIRVAKKYDRLATAYERNLFMPDHPDWPKRDDLPPLKDTAADVLSIMQAFAKRPDQVELTFKEVYTTVRGELTTPPEPEPAVAAMAAAEAA